MVNRPAVLDINPEVLDRSQASMLTELQRRMNAEPLTPETGRAFVDNNLFLLLPPEIRDHLHDPNGFRAAMEAAVLREFGEGAEGRPTINRLHALTTELVVQLSAHNGAGLHREAPISLFPDGASPREVREHLIDGPHRVAMFGGRIGRKVKLLLSTLTSLAGGYNYGQVGQEWLETRWAFVRQSDLLQNPNTQIALNILSAVVAGAVTTWLLKKWEDAVLDKGIEKNVGYFKAAGMVLKDQATKRHPIAAAAVLTFGVATMGYNALSDANGGISLTAGSADMAEQLEGIEAEVDSAIQQVQGWLDDAPEELRETALERGQAEVDREVKGKGASQREGRGALAYGKEALFINQDEGEAWLRANGSGISLEVLKALDGTGLVEDRYDSIGDHVYGLADGYRDDVQASLAKVQTARDRLASDRMAEKNEADIEKIQAELTRILEMIGPDGKLEGKLETAVEKYNAALKALGEVAKAHPKTYPKYKPGELESIALPAFDIDLGAMEIKNVDYKEAFALVNEMAKKGEMGKAVGYALLAILYAFAISFLDDAFFWNPTRRAHHVDRAEIGRQQQNYVRPLTENEIALFTMLLNTPYGHMARTLPVHPQAVREEVLRYVQEEVARRQPARGETWLDRLGTSDVPVIGSMVAGLQGAAGYFRQLGRVFRGSANPSDWDWTTMRNTPEANEYDLYLQTLVDVLGSPEHRRRITDRILPGNARLSESLANPLGTATQENDAHLSTENARYERTELEQIDELVPNVDAGAEVDNVNGPLATMDQLIGLQGRLGTMFRTRDAANTELHGRILATVQERLGGTLTLLGRVVEAQLAALTFRGQEGQYNREQIIAAREAVRALRQRVEIALRDRETNLLNSTRTIALAALRAQITQACDRKNREVDNAEAEWRVQENSRLLEAMQDRLPNVPAATATAEGRTTLYETLTQLITLRTELRAMDVGEDVRNTVLKNGIAQDIETRIQGSLDTVMDAVRLALAARPFRATETGPLQQRLITDAQREVENLRVETDRALRQVQGELPEQVPATLAAIEAALTAKSGEAREANVALRQEEEARRADRAARTERARAGSIFGDTVRGQLDRWYRIDAEMVAGAAVDADRRRAQFEASLAGWNAVIASLNREAIGATVSLASAGEGEAAAGTPVFNGSHEYNGFLAYLYAVAQILQGEGNTGLAAEAREWMGRVARIHGELYPDPTKTAEV